MSRAVRTALLAAVVAAPLATLAAAPAATAAPSARTHTTQTASTTGRQDAFAAASKKYGVPLDVLLGVSYLESRWDGHAGRPSTAGGYGPMHLTDVNDAERADLATGMTTVRPSAAALHTAQLAARLTGSSVDTVKTDGAANVAGGAAVLASYQKALGHATGASSDAGGWYGAVARYSGSPTTASAKSFANLVFQRIHDGAARTTDDGQRVTLKAKPAVDPRTQQADELKLASGKGGVECPKGLGCLWIPAPYEQYGDTSADYGNHDLADRPHDLKIKFIVIHDTEETFENTLNLVQDPTYVSWQYTIRSSDGLVAQHVKAKDVAWQAGNWYTNMHSIGVEHEGYEAQGSWYTEAMYENSSSLVRYLTKKYDIPRDNAHVIGHGQVPGTTAATVAGMHTDPGPFWDWEHYMQLLKSPIGRDHVKNGGVVTIKPGYAHNAQTVTGCDDADPSAACSDARSTNFVYLRQNPTKESPLVTDVALKPDGSPSTTDVSDNGARAQAGSQYAYAGTAGDWTAIWYLGKKAWFYNPKKYPTAVRSHGTVVTPKAGAKTIPSYGRAYPEQSAYPEGVPYQTVTPLQYTIPAGQSYVLEDKSLQTDYYYAVEFNAPTTQVKGKDKYYWISLGHRLMYVRAADVTLKKV